MKSLVLYDSTFGNTKKIAEVVAMELGNNTKATLVSEFDPKDLEGVDLLVVGSPINGWRPTPNTQNFLNSLKPGQLKGVKATSFDTRVKLFIHGDAKEKIAKSLKEKGAEIAAAPQAFTVKGTKGPLFEGEIEKAKEWGRSLILKNK